MNSMYKSQRSYEKELLDLGPSYYTQKEYDDCLNQLSRIGKYLGGNQATLKELDRYPAPKNILEFGCGGGQFAIQLGKKLPSTEIVGADISPEAISFAKQRLDETLLNNVSFIVADTFSSFLSNTFDIVTCTLLCHHLDDDQLIDFLKNSYHIAKKTVIINDLHRHWLAYSGFAVISRIFFPNRLIYHDGLLSIKRSLTKQDWLHYLKAAGIPIAHCKITWHWAFRWIVTIDASLKSH